MHPYSRIVEEVLELVSIELYAVAGSVSGGRLLVAGFREGSRNIYAYNGGGLVRLNREPVLGVAEPPPNAERVVFYRDVARGRELSRIYVVSIDKPGHEKPLHPGQEPARILGLADDGKSVAFSAVHERGVGVYAVRGKRLWKAVDAPGIAMVTSIRGDLVAGIGIFPPETRLFKPFTVDLSTSTFRVHEPPVKGNTIAIRIAPDGFPLYALEAAREAILYRLDPDSGKSSAIELQGMLKAFRPTSVNYLSFTSDGSLLVVARRRGRSKVFIDNEPLDLPEGMHGAAVEWRDEIAVTHSSKTTPTRIVAVKPGEKGWRTVLEGEKPKWLSEVFGETGYAEPTSSDGSKVPTLYLESGRAGKPGPTVILVHGGPFAEDTDTWDIFAAALAAAGFHVVQPNYRGSLGYGVEWTEKIIGDPCGAELSDVLAATKWALEAGLANHVYIMGYSYGGYLTLCALTQAPGMFRAGVAGASVTDWEEMYELSDPAFKQFIEMLFAGKRELWRERSPITHIDKLSEPLAMIHPLNDTRTPLKPVLKFVEKASEKGKSIELHVAPDMGHVVNTVEDAVKILLPALLFLVRMKGKEE